MAFNTYADPKMTAFVYVRWGVEIEIPYRAKTLKELYSLVKRWAKKNIFLLAQEDKEAYPSWPELG